MTAISFHRAIKVEAIPNTSGGTSWIDIIITDAEGRTEEVQVYAKPGYVFDFHAQAIESKQMKVVV